MKKILLALPVLFLSQVSIAADSAGLVGIMNTSGTVEVNNFLQPKYIWTFYISNDPSEKNVLLIYAALMRLGKHQLSVEWTDKKGNLIDTCTFDATSVTKLPHIHTSTCNWGGRLPDGGLTFLVSNTFEGKKEKIGEMYLPSKN
jgi:hypothetical protein